MAQDAAATLLMRSVGNVALPIVTESLVRQQTG